MIGYKAGKKVENSQFPGNQNLEDFKAYIFELIDIYFQLNCALRESLSQIKYLTLNTKIKDQVLRRTVAEHSPFLSIFVIIVYQC